jgi:hypothetical protein
MPVSPMEHRPAKDIMCGSTFLPRRAAPLPASALEIVRPAADYRRNACTAPVGRPCSTRRPHPAVPAELCIKILSPEDRAARMIGG